MWRKKAVAELEKKNPQVILDVATGTGDMLVELSRLQPKKLMGVDLSDYMMLLAEKKLKRQNIQATLKKGDAEKLPFASHTFDGVTVAFGVRNYEHLFKGVKELHRVLKKEGVAIVLELSLPSYSLLKQFYGFYFNRLMPFFGRIISGDKDAYTYLKTSVHHFPKPKAFVAELKKAGFSKVTKTALTLGTCTLYVAEK